VAVEKCFIDPSGVTSNILEDNKMIPEDAILMIQSFAMW
jgi:hypothetical protein